MIERWDSDSAFLEIRLTLLLLVGFGVLLGRFKLCISLLLGHCYIEIIGLAGQWIVEATKLVRQIEVELRVVLELVAQYLLKLTCLREMFR
jgi:hypothetical protein